MLLTQGGRHVGFALYLQDGRLHHVLNYVGLEQFRVTSPDPVPEGRQVLRYEFERTGDPVDMFHGRGVPGRSKLYVGGALVAVSELPYSLVASPGFYGVTCGYAHADSVDPVGVPAAVPVHRRDRARRPRHGGRGDRRRRGRAARAPGPPVT